MTGIILCGGKGSRLGYKNKPLLKIGEKTLIERVISRLKEVCLEEIICVNETNFPSPLFTNYPSVITIQDIIPQKGPLVGLYTGLCVSKNFYNFVVASDMPFISVNLIKYMKEQTGDADIIIPKTKNGIESLHAIYSKNCLDVLRQKIDNEKLAISSIFSELKVKYILEEEILKFSIPEIAFFNINTEKDLSKAERLANEFEK
ncbi:MAG: molybdenum cofactor guanylyltransferase [bacterium]